MGKFRRNKPPKSESPLISNKQTSKTPIVIPKSPLLVQSKSIKKVYHLENGKILFSKTTQEKKLTSKKDKIKKKRNVLMKKFELIKKQQKANIAKMNREKAAVIGDLKPLKDALPSLNELFKLNRDEIKTGISEFDSNINSNENSRKNRNKKKKIEMINRYNCFENLLKDSDYKKNPREAIAYHIKYTHNLVDG